MKTGRFSLFNNNKIRQPSLKTQSAFTIVELLVVIVVIGILTAITIVSYIGITNRANAAALQSDLSNASKQLKVYQTTNDTYPVLESDNCNTDHSFCLKTNTGETLTYQVDNTSNPVTFTLYAAKNNTTYRITSESTPTTVAKICPIGFIVVPGSATYGTSDFCVMKYEAKQVGATTTPISQASGLPWVNISQTTAITNSANVVGCIGCHLITEAEWMTLAQNVLSVASNWSGGAVGSGFIYNGHANNNPASALAADNNDSNNLVGMTSTGTTSGSNTKRTLTLTNGEVIWDMAGNVYDWTAGQITGTQPGTSGEAAYTWHQWNAVTQNGFPTSSMPASTGIANISTWTSTNGIGNVYSYYSEAGLRGFIRGGDWYRGTNAGVLCLGLNIGPSGTGSSIGFRVAGS